MIKGTLYDSETGKKTHWGGLRVCASCEWIFHIEDADMCPKCGFGHYGARYVYGKKAYRYAITQKPWFDRKMGTYASKLYEEIKNSKPLDEFPFTLQWIQAHDGYIK
jgi:hypothetical protein